MGTRTNHYIILGVRLPYEGVACEKYEKFTDTSWEPKKSGFVVLVDGMNGNYVVAGHVLAATPNDESGEQYFDPPMVLDITKEHVKAVRKDLLEKIGVKGDPKIIVLTTFR